jgi:hypothetical protein
MKLREGAKENGKKEACHEPRVFKSSSYLVCRHGNLEILTFNTNLVTFQL